MLTGPSLSSISARAGSTFNARQMPRRLARTQMITLADALFLPSPIIERTIRMRLSEALATAERGLATAEAKRSMAEEEVRSRLGRLMGFRLRTAEDH